MAMMANRWAARGHHVTLVTLDSIENDTYPLSADVDRIPLNAMLDSANVLAAVRNNVRRLHRLRSAIRNSQPDVVLSFIDQMNVLTLLATRGLRFDVIVSERIDPRHHSIGRSWSMLRRLMYPRATAVVVQTERVRRSLAEVIPAARIHVIPNSVESPSDPRESTRDENSSASILAMGRLVPQKGFDLLIEAFAKVAQQYANWNLIITGNGPERDRLAMLAVDQGLQNRVVFHDWTPNPAP